MMDMRRLSDCSLADALQAWNQGFADYYVNVQQTADKWVARMAMEGLSPDLSLVAFADGQPVGLVLNGVRQIGGRRVAWNGGTSVIPAYRQKGVGKALIRASLEICREAGAEVATLEAFRQNERAISLYRQMGYEIVDELLFLQRDGAFGAPPFAGRDGGACLIRHAAADDVRDLPFYRSDVPWQTQWQSARAGEALLAVDSRSGEVVGYALFRRLYDELGALASIALLQCEAGPGREDAPDILRALLREAFAPHNAACRRFTYNLPQSRTDLIPLLEEEGFSPSITQVHMVRNLSESAG